MALWTPAEITTALWLDAADSSTLFDATSGGSLPGNGVGVARWEDKSGNSRHVTQSISVNRPLRLVAGQNGLDVISFDGINDSLMRSQSMDLLNNKSGGTIFAVFRWQSTPTINRRVVNISTDNVNTARVALSAGLASNKAYLGGRRLTADSFQRIDSSSNVPDEFYLSSGVVDYQGRKLWLFHNGTIESQIDTFQSGGNTESTNSAGIGIGQLGNNSANFGNVEMSECVVLELAVDTTDRQLIEGYLAWKWGLQGNLPNDHPYKNAAPTTGRRRNNALIGLL